MPETVTIDQAANLAGVSKRSIYIWLKAGKLKFCRTAGGQIRIDPASLWTEWRGGEGQPVRLARDEMQR